ncbi:MAG: Beta-monoglucosyldiacylglycerol synthase [Syntrophorhabdus sp. PtaB.Bin184]|jgi:1,2-diacylglycerol 3-beta-glucosyltransferase|nr:MAG: Beta-monoglucosyldiacylglycerol synthase [Syntrophorhabdus sp. PtaB.Bin184]
MSSIISILWIPVLGYLTFSVFYYVFLAITYFVTGDKKETDYSPGRRYLLLIPAHNEEAVIGRILESVKRVKYNPKDFETYVIADNCTDRTAEIAGQLGANVLVRKDETKKSKGFAIEWALKQVDLEAFDAVAIVDADSLINLNFFHGFDEVIEGGSNAIQANNWISNPDETAFTRVLHLSRTINNELYHHAKQRLGLYSFLMGNGMCFTTKVIKNHPWTTDTMAEDFEYYATLVNSNERVGFAADSGIYLQESRGLRNASRQRLRWSSGRFQIAKRHALDLLVKGLKERNLKIVDASFPLILPNLSLLVNMTAVALTVALVIHYFNAIPYIVSWLIFLVAMELAYFISGIHLAKMSVWTFLGAIGFAPLFLIWKGCIDVLGVFGTGTGQWGKSGRS